MEKKSLDQMFSLYTYFKCKGLCLPVQLVCRYSRTSNNWKVFKDLGLNPNHGHLSGFSHSTGWAQPACYKNYAKKKKKNYAKDIYANGEYIVCVVFVWSQSTEVSRKKADKQTYRHHQAAGQQIGRSFTSWL